MLLLSEQKESQLYRIALKSTGHNHRMTFIAHSSSFQSQFSTPSCLFSFLSYSSSFCLSPQQPVSLRGTQTHYIFLMNSKRDSCKAQTLKYVEEIHAVSHAVTHGHFLKLIHNWDFLRIQHL